MQTLYGIIAPYNIELLESVQLETARIITGLRSGTSHNKLYNEPGWETLSARRYKHKQIMMYKTLTSILAKCHKSVY